MGWKEPPKSFFDSLLRPLALSVDKLTGFTTALPLVELGAQKLGRFVDEWCVWYRWCIGKSGDVLYELDGGRVLGDAIGKLDSVGHGLHEWCDTLIGARRELE